GANQVWDVQTNATTYELSELDGSKTVFARQAGSNIYQVVSDIGPEAASATRYQYDTADGRSLVKRVIPPVEPGVDDANHCTVNPLPRGCEVMEYDYAKVTTATATTPGDHADRIRSAKVWSWNPATSKQEAVEVTHYVYDDKGRIAQVWDPRLAQPLKTTYSYDADGRVTRITPAGQLPWNFDYGTAAADQDPGRLLKVRRAALAQGSKDQVNGEVPGPTSRVRNPDGRSIPGSPSRRRSGRRGLSSGSESGVRSSTSGTGRGGSRWDQMIQG
ncbi:RHS repeat domain-containing protein, partial [Kitasatospora sp. NPDC057500]|uniref:RHS repeat domain-containing protein n=1 Tax=Kitasatospora sp. NPDC057500 TaxID=3346151 RepID=UPI0036C21EE0